MSRTALMVIDMQNGFVTPECRRVIPAVKTLINAANRKDVLVVFTKFINKESSGYVRWIGWHRLMNTPETSLIDELSEHDDAAYLKTQYSSFTPDVVDHFELHNISRLIMCGVATDGCVLKTAVDAFERDIKPIVVTDACYSHAGETVHEAGLLLLSRFIGRKQLVTSRDALQML